jgi:hypothetical protein
MTRRFRQGAAKGSVVAQMIGRDALEELLAQPGGEGMPICCGEDLPGSARLTSRASTLSFGRTRMRTHTRHPCPAAGVGRLPRREAHGSYC